MVWNHHNNEPMCLNGCVLVVVGLLKLIVASAGEAKVGGLFWNTQDRKVL